MKVWCVILFLVPVIGIAQSNFGAVDMQSGMRKRLLDASLNVTKTGPYLGLQQGKYTVLEVGAEREWKTIQLRDAHSHAVNTGFNYNFKYKVLGYDIGYWWRPHRVGLTVGGTLFLRTDFDRTKVGIAPAVGFKFWMLHLRTGYHFMPRPKEFETNTFFISLRIGIVNDRDFELKR